MDIRVPLYEDVKTPEFKSSKDGEGMEQDFERQPVTLCVCMCARYIIEYMNKCAIITINNNNDNNNNNNKKNNT